MAIGNFNEGITIVILMINGRIPNDIPNCNTNHSRLKRQLQIQLNYNKNNNNTNQSVLFFSEASRVSGLGALVN